MPEYIVIGLYVLIGLAMGMLFFMKCLTYGNLPDANFPLLILFLLAVGLFYFELKTKDEYETAHSVIVTRKVEVGPLIEVNSKELPVITQASFVGYATRPDDIIIKLPEYINFTYIDITNERRVIYSKHLKITDYSEKEVLCSYMSEAYVRFCFTYFKTFFANFLYKQYERYSLQLAEHQKNSKESVAVVNDSLDTQGLIMALERDIRKYRYPVSKGEDYDAKPKR